MSVTQSCPTLYNPVDFASVPRILQARTLEWVAIPLSRGSPWPRDQTQVSHIAGRFFTVWAIREAHMWQNYCLKVMKKLEHYQINRWRRQWDPTPVLLPGKSHGRRSLVGCSSWGREESDMTGWLHFHFSLSCIGEGNGNPLQCSCLENPRDGGAWWAAVYGVAQSWTRLKWLSSNR